MDAVTRDALFPWLFPLLILGLLVGSLVHAWRVRFRDGLFFFAAAGYGFALEASQRLFLRYTYARFGPHYEGIPLIVPLGWAGVFYLSRWIGRRVTSEGNWMQAVLAGALVTLGVVLPVEGVAVQLRWWVWAEKPAVAGIPLFTVLQTFSAGLTFLLGYELVARMNLRGIRIRILFLLLTLSPLLFIHAEGVFIARALLARL